MALDPTTGAPLFEPDPLAALLALKQDGVTNPMTGDTVSPGLAEQIPGEMLPTPGTDPGNSGRYAQLFAALSAPSPELATQRADEQTAQAAHDAAVSSADPAVLAQAGRAQAADIAKAQAVPQANAAGTIAVENAKAAGQLAVAGVNANAKTAAANAVNQKLPLQTQQKAIQAGGVADELDRIDREVDDPDLQPYIGVMAGRLTDLTEGKLLPQSLAASLTPDPAIQTKLAKFSSDLATSAAAVSAAHGRGGAANPALMAEYKNSLSRSTTPAMLHGAISSAKDWMMTYAHPNPLGQLLGTTPTPASTVPIRQFDPATGKLSP